jgi:fluoride ion exporter CrcB/FEX
MMMPELTVSVVAAGAVGGAIGAIARFLLDRYLRAGILLANTIGCLFLGLLVGFVSALAASGAAEDQAQWQPLAVGLLALGLTGALSTFATVALRAALKWTAGARWKAVGMWSIHVVCGVAAAVAGLVLGWQLAV